MSNDVYYKSIQFLFSKKTSDFIKKYISFKFGTHFFRFLNQ